MALADMARKLQEEKVPQEVEELRRMRRFVAKHDYDEMNSRWAAVAQLQEAGEQGTLVGQYEILKRVKELHRDESLLKLYKATLAFAARREREEAGGGALFLGENKERIARAEVAICKEAKDWQQMQICLGDGETTDK